MRHPKIKFYYWILGIMLCTALILKTYYHFAPADITSGQSTLASAKTASVTVGTEKFKVYLASTPKELTNGLSNVPSLPKGEGMLFLFNQAGYPTFWMKDMKFDLDFVWIRDGKVIGLDANVSSSFINSLKTLRPAEPVNYVLELNAGEIAGHNLKVGDVFSVTY